LKFTVLGGNGYIGRNVSTYLAELGHEVFVSGRNMSGVFGTDLGHVIYAIGLTGDFRTRPFDTVEAHVCRLREVLSSASFDSFLYLSSTRLYGAREGLARETDLISARPGLDAVYDVSKLLGESLCLSIENKKIRVARLSNVYGPGQSANTFLGSIRDELKARARVTIQEAPDSCKDYVCISDVVKILSHIAVCGKERLYNVASGCVTSHGQIADQINKLRLGSVSFSPSATSRRFPKIGIDKILDEVKIEPRSVLADIESLIQNSLVKD
jgi:nucleoside-diphosphate-sugar epimerase